MSVLCTHTCFYVVAVLDKLLFFGQYELGGEAGGRKKRKRASSEGKTGDLSLKARIEWTD